MSNKKQTAVDWFFSELERMQYFIGNDMLQAYEDAKEIEKEQIINAHGIKKDYSFSQIDPQIITGEQYYKENYEQ